MLSAGLATDPGSYGTVVIAATLVLLGPPTLVYLWVIGRWRRTGRWWGVATMDAAIAGLALASAVGALRGPASDIAIPASICATAVLGGAGVFLSRGRRDPKVGTLTRRVA
jgi:hypothetical protein